MNWDEIVQSDDYLSLDFESKRKKRMEYLKTHPQENKKKQSDEFFTPEYHALPGEKKTEFRKKLYDTYPELALGIERLGQIIQPSALQSEPSREAEKRKVEGELQAVREGGRPVDEGLESATPMLDAFGGGVIKGKTFGIIDPARASREGRISESDIKPPETPLEKGLYTGGEILGGLTNAAWIADKLSKVKKIADIGNTAVKLATIRGGTALLSSGARNATSLAREDKDLARAIQDTGIDTIGSLIGMLPETYVKPGIGNLISQVGVDTMFDIAADITSDAANKNKPDYQQRFKPNDPKYWAELGVRETTSAYFAARDFFDPDFKLQQQAVKQGIGDVGRAVKESVTDPRLGIKPETAKGDTLIDNTEYAEAVRAVEGGESVRRIAAKQGFEKHDIERQKKSLDQLISEGRESKIEPTPESIQESANTDIALAVKSFDKAQEAFDKGQNFENVVEGFKASKDALSGPAQAMRVRQELLKEVANDPELRRVGDVVARTVALLTDNIEATKLEARELDNVRNTIDVDSVPARQLRDVPEDLFTKIESKTPLTEAEMNRLPKKLANTIEKQTRERELKWLREYKKTSATDWVNLIRYNSMLSSPITQVRNIVSNAAEAGLRPMRHTVMGVVDWLHSKFTGKPRDNLTGEGLAYAREFAQLRNYKKAWQNFKDVVSGKKVSGLSELRNTPISKEKTLGRLVENILSPPAKVLQGMDVYFRTLSETANKAREFKKAIGTGKKFTDRLLETINKKAKQESLKDVFQEPLGEGGGVLFRGIDALADIIVKARNSSDPVVKTVANLTFPFIQIPTNLLKRGLAGTPVVGMIDMIGRKGTGSRQELLAQQIMGGALAMTFASLVSSDNTTWGTPREKKKKALFKAAGRLPYSVKIGDKWVSYAYLHPQLAFPMALMSAISEADKNKRITESKSDAILQGVSQGWRFFTDQSFVKNLGDFVNTLSGDVEGAPKVVTTYAQQFVPFRAMLGWINRIIDEPERTPDEYASIIERHWQNFKTALPGLAQTVPEREDPFGRPVTRGSVSERLINAISPVQVRKEEPQMGRLADMSNEVTRANRIRSDIVELAMREDWEKLEKIPKKMTGFSEVNAEKMQKVFERVLPAIKRIMAREDLSREAKEKFIRELVAPVVQVGTIKPKTELDMIDNFKTYKKDPYNAYQEYLQRRF